MTRMLRVVLAVMCVCAVPSWATAQDDAFKQGLQARGDKKWPEVVRHMQNAVKPTGRNRPARCDRDSSACKGMEYLPHYFLGEAFLNMRDCGGAVAEWSISEQQGAIKTRTEFLATMQKGLQTCASKGVLLGADYTPLFPSTRQSTRTPPRWPSKSPISAIRIRMCGARSPTNRTVAQRRSSMRHWPG